MSCVYFLIIDLLEDILGISFTARIIIASIGCILESNDCYNVINNYLAVTNNLYACCAPDGAYTSVHNHNIMLQRTQRRVSVCPIVVLKRKAYVAHTLVPSVLGLRYVLRLSKYAGTG